MQRLLAKALVLGVVVGCGAGVDRPSTADELPQRMREVASPKICLAKRRLLEELGHDALATAAGAREGKPELEPRLDRGDAPPIEVAYGVAAPATALIRTSGGMGSGVIVDPRGLVLTNQHVVDEFLQLDLTIKVTLELGRMGPTGRMKRGGQALAGVVVKTDAVKDLALVKLIDPPKDLPVATVAPVDPRVGESVLSIGNAGIGLLWAAKVCNVSRVGDLTRETSILEAGDCSLRDPNLDEDEAERQAEQCEARKREIKEQVEQALQGLSIQTTCSLNGGDSGGPLVNAWGEVVGLNHSLRFGGGTLAFHVHVAEIREFLADVSLDPVAVVPDPFCDGGTDITLEDYDGDGVAESAVTAGLSFADGSPSALAAYLFDIDEDDRKSKPSAERPFDADIAIMLKGGDAYAFYDQNADGAFDLLVRDKKADGRPELSFELDHGKAVPDPSLLPRYPLDPDLLRDRGHLARLGAVAVGAGIPKLAAPEALASGEIPAVPDVAKTFGKHGSVADIDDDGTPESVVIYEGPGRSALLVDVESLALANLKHGDDAGPVLDPFMLRPQFVLLERLAGTWALYDLDNAGGFDLALFSRKPAVDAADDDTFVSAPEYASHAFLLPIGKPRVETKQHLGRSLVRPDLLAGVPAQRALLRHRSGTRGGFPDPRDSFWDASTWALTPLEHDRQVLEQAGKYAHVAMVDLDRDTKKRESSTPEELATEDHFDAEVIMVRIYDRGWVYHDTNRDGAMDLVLFTRNAGAGMVDSAFRIDAAGELVTAEPSPTGALVRPDAVGASTKAADALRQLLYRVMQ
jgi:S1-C subfamily serine protease